MPAASVMENTITGRITVWLEALKLSQLIHCDKMISEDIYTVPIISVLLHNENSSLKANCPM